MGLEDRVQIWKDPERRRSGADHPAGEITLSYIGGDEAGTIFTCMGNCTDWNCTVFGCPETWEPECSPITIYCG